MTNNSVKTATFNSAKSATNNPETYNSRWRKDLLKRTRVGFMTASPLVKSLAIPCLYLIVYHIVGRVLSANYIFVTVYNLLFICLFCSKYVNNFLDINDFKKLGSCRLQSISILIMVIAAKLLFHFAEDQSKFDLLSFEGLLIIIVPPFVEEVIRAYILDKLSIVIKQGAVLIIVMTVVNMLAHNFSYNITYGVNCFIMGILLSISYYRTRVIGFSVSCHMLWNLLYFLPPFRS